MSATGKKTGKKVALLTTDCVDEWLDAMHLGLGDFRHTQCGGWFNTLQALAAAGYSPTLMGTSARVTKPTHFFNTPTGANIVMLPSSRLYRWLKQRRDGARAHSLRARMLSTLVAYTSLPLPAFIAGLRDHASDGLLIEQYGTARMDIAVVVAGWLDIPTYGLFSAFANESKVIIGRLLRRYTMKKAQGFGVCSAREASRLVTAWHIPADRLHAMVFPVDTGFWTPQDQAACRASLAIPPDSRVAIWHGVFDINVKGLDVLVAAWAEVKRRHPHDDFRLLIIGNRHGSESLKQLITAAGASGIQLVDQWIHDRVLLRSYLNAADVFVFPSRIEPFGIAPVEAMACGLPAVLSTAAGVTELFVGEQDGVLKVDPADVLAWATAVEHLLVAPALSKTLGANAQRAVAQKAAIASGAQALATMLDARVGS